MWSVPPSGAHGLARGRVVGRGRRAARAARAARHGHRRVAVGRAGEAAPHHGGARVGLVHVAQRPLRRFVHAPGQVQPDVSPPRYHSSPSRFTTWLQFALVRATVRVTNEPSLQTAVMQ